MLYQLPRSLFGIWQQGLKAGKQDRLRLLGSSVDPRWSKVNSWSADSCITLPSLLGFTCPAMLKKQHIASELQKIIPNSTWKSLTTLLLPQ